ncbi:phage tail protein [Laribacter hongkongensis]|uniref:phage tail protein n=1 Tax=Laribacter hongkongensis TaxID=168471 RepID=UPI001EFE296C|nr:phage tail protein [Laribacter hongkongensis]MCG8993332.1 phage tail protein [Laribacter hongkongensis]MCG8997690.1 phage tail protein [Laribacter hongkongensis]MCG9001445.1 phage tail protein [Laribacter hongkongensis]MCG9004602.1 phage tail protein [Laribacter hongkongensis]MCG9007492.1 phage tail protein [Laribacter hongkongensis]
MANEFFTILTATGKAKLAAAQTSGTPLQITQMAVGDGDNGAYYNPVESQTTLKHETWRGALNNLSVDASNPNWIVAELVIPDTVGGFYIREVGLFDSTGALIAVGKFPESYKPTLAAGSNKQLYVRMILEVSNASAVTLLVDPSVVLATRATVDQRIAEELAKLDGKPSVKVATTAAIALTGLQTIDGVALVAGDRVLVKDQAAAKDNGIYVASAGAWARAADADASIEVTPGLFVSVEQGTANADSIWQLVTDAPITLGTTGLAFEMLDGKTGVAAGTYRSVTVNQRGQVMGGTNPTTLAGYGLIDQIVSQSVTAFTSAGVAPAFTLTPSPALAGYAANLRFRVKFHTAGSGNDTLNVSGLGAKSLKQYDASGAKVAAVIAANQLADVEYDGTDWVIVDPLPAASLPGFRNRLINGAFKIDHRNRGAVQTYTAGAELLYGIDRWYGYCSGANVTGQQVALPNRQNRYRFTGAASNTAVGFGQRIEASGSMDLAGSSATLQVKASSSSLTSLTWTAYYANSADSFGSLASPTRTQIATGTFTISATEATYSAQIAIPAAATTGIEIVFSGGALLATQTLTIGDVQLEPGVVATPFELRPAAAELALSQRFYEVTMFTLGIYNGGAVTGACFGNVPFKVTKRATPSIALSSLTYSNSSSAVVGNIFTTSISVNANIAAIGLAFLYGTCSADAEL